MRSVLFVCTANICRSPMAEGVLRKLLADRGKAADLEIDSVGTHNYHAGEPPFPMAVDAASKRGYEIKHLKARTLSPADLDHFDMILVMDRANLRHLKTIAPTRCKEKIELLLDHGEKYFGKEVPDPFGKKEKDFELALDMIEDGCAGLVQLLIRRQSR